MIALREVSKTVTSGTEPLTILHPLTTEIPRGQFVAVVGPSGSGKSTLLGLIAGLDAPTSGSVVIDGVDITKLDEDSLAKLRGEKIGFVFQFFHLIPSLTAYENVAVPMEIAGASGAAERARQLLEEVGLTGRAHHYPSQLSGGEQQRVALARALAPKPKLLLLDEPLSALDAKVRVSLREEIRSIQKRLGITTIFVTHDQEEALSISDRIAVMYGGKAEQVGTPFEIYNRPATKFVANFVGTLNVLEGIVTDPALGKVRVSTEEVALKGKLNGSKAGDTLSLALRPEAISLGRHPGRDSSLSGEIAEVHFLGSVIRVRVGIGGNTVSLDTFNNAATPPPAVGEKAEISFSSSDMLVLH
jgi:putative spermidine/putrescine transport system ATP-binding protein